jgi:hypothetical protein
LNTKEIFETKKKISKTSSSSSSFDFGTYALKCFLP